MKNKNLELTSFDKEENLIDQNDNFIHNIGYHLENHNYKKLNPESWYDSKSDFNLSKISKIYEIKKKAIFFCIFHFISFYVLLTAYILSKDIKLLIFLIIVYIIGTFAQMTTIPDLIKFKTRTQFEKDIYELLNSWAYCKLYYNKVAATFPAKYTIDVTGELIIPKGYNYVRIKNVEIFADFFKFKEKFKETYHLGEREVQFEREIQLIYEGKKIYISDDIYKLNSDDDNVYSINILHTFFSILLCPWILSIYYNYAKEGKCIDIYLAKILYNKAYKKEILPKSKNKIIIHNKKYEIKPYIVNDIQINNKQFEKDYKEIQNKKEEIRREKEELEKNTEILSEWNNKNYYIEVKRIYDDVYLTFFAYEKRKRHTFKKKLGYYDPEIKERIERSDKITTYYPRGYDMRIEVIRDITSYTVTIGDDDDEYYTENIPLYNNS